MTKPISIYKNERKGQENQSKATPKKMTGSPPTQKNSRGQEIQSSPT